MLDVARYDRKSVRNTLNTNSKFKARIYKFLVRTELFYKQIKISLQSWLNFHKYSIEIKAGNKMDVGRTKGQ